MVGVVWPPRAPPRGAVQLRRGSSMLDLLRRQRRRPNWLFVGGVLITVLLAIACTGRRALTPAPITLGQPASLAAIVGIAAGHDHSSNAGAIVPLSSAAAIDPTLGPRSNLVLTPLDSTIRANWTASSDPQTVRYAFSVWDGSTLVGTKMVPAN